MKIDVKELPIILLFLIVIAYLSYNLFLFLPFIENQYLINDDARQVIAPFYAYIYPENFSNDILSKYAMSYNPIGYRSLYKIVSLCGIDPLFFSKIMTFVLIVIIWASGFLIGNAIGGKVCGMFTVLLVAHSEFIINRTFGAYPRGFAFPVFFLFIYFLIKEKFGWAISLLFLQSLLYPPSFLIIWVTFSFYMLVHLKEWISSKKGLILIFIIQTIISVVILYGIRGKGGDFGRLVTVREAENMPEWSRIVGRFPILPFLPDKIMIIEGFKKGINSIGPSLFPYLVDWNRKHGNIIFWIYLFTMAIGLFFIKPSRYWWFCITGAGLSLYFLAKFFAFRLFLPDRYITNTLPVSFLLLFPITWKFIQQMSSYWSTVLKGICILIIISIFIFYPLGFSGIGEKTIDISGQMVLLNFIKEMPEQTFLAGWPTTMDNVPLFAYKKVLVNYEMAHPLYLGYYAEIKERMRDTLKLYFATDKDTVLSIRDKYNLSHLVVEKEVLNHNDLLPLVFEPFFEPFLTEAVRLKFAGLQKGFFFSPSPSGSVIFETDDHLLIDLRKVNR